MLPLLPWWFLVTVLSLVALPLTMSLLRHLPDRGYPFARFLGVLLPSYLAWFLGMWQLASYGRGLLIFCLLVVAALSGLLLWRDRSILQFFREHWRLVLGYETLFAVALVGGAILRIYGLWSGPAISHTEQPMDFALMNGIIQSRALPPHDPWLAGFSINYYYLGYFLAASLTLLSGISSSITFNLNLALIFALTVSGAFSVAYNLTAAVSSTSRQRAIIAGALATLFVAVATNQIGAFQILSGSNQMAPLNAGELWTVLSMRLSGNSDSIPLGHTVYLSGDAFGGQFDTVSPTWGRQSEDFDLWWPSRVLWDERPSLEAVNRILASGQGEGILSHWRVLVNLLRWRSFSAPEEIRRSYAITEFPFFSFYLGDMHPHVMTLPMTLLVLALALQVVLTPERGRPGLGAGRWSWFYLSLHALVLGGLYMANSWDFPTYLLLYGAAWVWRWRQGASGGWTRKDWLASARDLGILVGLCILLYLPFFITFRSLVGSKEIYAEVLQVPILGGLARLPVLSKLLQTVGPVLWDKTSLHTLLIIFGLFLYPALSWLLAKRIQLGRKVSVWGWVGMALCLLAAVLLGFPLLVLLPFLWLGWDLLGESRPAEASALLMLMLALLLVFGCDLVYIRDVFENRMNTIFKFYYQAWMLLAIVGAWAIGQAGRAFLRTAPAEVEPGRTLRRTYRPLLLALWLLPLLPLLAGALVYPVQALRTAAGGEREWTLDGLTMMQNSYPGDYAGVRWLWENAEPDAVVLEATGPEWGYYSRISAATGLATLLGWDGHELQWRGGHPEALEQVGPRQDVIELIYQTSSTEEARQLLQQYEVDYVFLGSLEANISAENRAKFAHLGVLVFEAPGVQIYQVTD